MIFISIYLFLFISTLFILRVKIKIYIAKKIQTVKTDLIRAKTKKSSSKQKNDCYNKEAKIKLDINGSIKVRNSYPNNPII